MPKLDELLLPQMTVRETLIKCFEDNWDTRRVVSEAAENTTFTAGLNFTVAVTMQMAKEVLAGMPRVP